MTDYTPILRLVQPAFDQNPWDTDMNNDLAILDAAVGKFFGVANMAGVWLNATAYSVGQVVVDQADSSMWSCAIAHTSATAPTTFASDRAANPTFWISAASTAQEYAAQAQTYASSAAGSATAAATSATNAANSAAIVAGALPLSGGTMTGNLTLHADPTTALMAATKQYVDARVGGTGFLPTTGGTLTGFLTLNADPTSLLHAATKQYVDTMLPKAGGTMTGVLNAGAGLTASTMTVGTGSDYELYKVGTASNVLQFSASGYYWSWTVANGNLTWVIANLALWVMRTSDRLCYNNIAAVGGVGAYVNLSDERAKHDIAQLAYGMDELRDINPISFIRDSKDEYEFGFSAQNVQGVLPEAVSIFKDDLMAVSSEMILAVVVNAVKELDLRIRELGN